MLFSIRSLAVVTALAAVGCGKSRTPEYTDLTGTVTRDGRPLGGIVVTFDPAPGPTEKGARAEGLTDENGVYRLRTPTADRDGVVVGVYRVTLKQPSASGSREAPVPRDYTIPARSPLGPVAVAAGPQTFDIAVPPNRVAAKRP